ncbi:Suppressor of fused like protein [Fasciolopsis buskii]|uniref:Suppressor of fused like protein n=1 Tax=Fasciolopsis buskii TaxID=27845 RepID=A0A8E0VJ09_9TREM|nr:Suppressor of fused like protein [Fasciolopsis buski]
MSHHNFGSVLGPVSNSTAPAGPQIVREEQALGLKAIYAACRILYPDQPTPLQVTALRKFWMGGPDPLDFINMYSNPGSIELGSPAHWHYVTNGLSDLYGDSRLHRSVPDVFGR